MAMASETPLWDRYWGSFGVCSVICLALQLYVRSLARVRKGDPANDVMQSLGLSSPPPGTDDTTDQVSRRVFAVFQRNYLVVYLLAVFADWLQGPYVYELYVYYGFDKGQISELFVCGFGSSMIVGTFVGGLADKVGRKRMCILYAVLYIIACFTKLCNSYWVLMLGRFLSGISTSLLFSVFESWMVCEHNKRGFDTALLADTFAYQTFGNGVVAVVAGLVANSAADTFGYVAPFMISIIPLVTLSILVSTTWNENFGNAQFSLLSSLQKGFDLIRRDARLAALGVAQSCYEGALYTFIFIWTPALKTVEELIVEASGDVAGVDPGEKIVHVQRGSGGKGGGGGGGGGRAAASAAAALDGHELTSSYLGIIFAVFMICVMIGSSIFRLLTQDMDGNSAPSTTLFRVPLYVHLVATASMGLLTLFLREKWFVYAMFLVFEGTTGVFYPSYGMIKSEKIPEDIRSAVMNILRIPLNIFVVLLLLKFKYLSSSTVLSVCTAAHAIAFVAYFYFYTTMRSTGGEGAALGGGGRREDDEETLLPPKNGE